MRFGDWLQKLRSQARYKLLDALMAKDSGFLEYARELPPKRPVSERVGDWRDVYDSFAPHKLQKQAARCMDCGVPFCQSGCPLGNAIPDWNDLVFRDNWREAYDRLDATNNFPEFTGRICPAPCESACVLGIIDEPVTIERIEQEIIEHAYAQGWVTPDSPKRRTGKQVAVVGSGPAGLAAAGQLNRAGHRVTVLERDDRIGGLLRYGIPDFKLEKWVLDRRLDLMEKERHSLCYSGKRGCKLCIGKTARIRCCGSMYGGYTPTRLADSWPQTERHPFCLRLFAPAKQTR